MKATKNKLSAAQLAELVSTLKTRFEKNMNRHKGLEWSAVEARIRSKGYDEKQWSLSEMERTGGEPDVVGIDKKLVSIFFMIVLLKALVVVEVFVTMPKHWLQEKRINRRIVQSMLRKVWALKY